MHKQLVGIRGATGILVDVEHDSGRDGDAAEIRGRPVGAGRSDQHGAAGRPIKVAGLEGTAGDGDIIDALVEFRPCAGVAVQTVSGSARPLKPNGRAISRARQSTPLMIAVSFFFMFIGKPP